MVSRHTSGAVAPGASPLVLRTESRWFLTRGIACGLLFPLLVYFVGFGRYAWLCPVGFGILWLLFRNSTITLDGNGFVYHSALRKISHSWDEIEGFSLVEQRLYGFIPISQFLGWTFTPAYKSYERLAIPRAAARLVGTPDAMFKPIGYNVKNLITVMNEYREQARATTREQERRSA